MLQPSYQDFEFPPSDHLSIWVKPLQGGLFEFTSISVCDECGHGPNTYYVHEDKGRMRALGEPVTVKFATLEKLEDLRFIRGLAEHMVSSPMGVHTLVKKTEIKITNKRARFWDMIFGAVNLHPATLDLIETAIEAAHERAVERQ